MSTKKYTKPSAAEIKGKLTPEQYRGDAGVRAPSRRSTTLTGTTTSRASTSTSSPASRCSARRTSSIRAPAGRASRSRSNRTGRRRSPTPATAWTRNEVRSQGARFAPGPRVRRRAGADAPALLHQLGVAALRPGRQAGGRGLRRVPRAVPAARERRRSGDRRAAGGEADARDGDPGGRLLLGHGGAAAQDPGRGRDRGRLHGRQDARTRRTATFTTGRPATPRRCAWCSTRAS